MEQKKKALGRGLEQLFSSEVLDFDTFEDNIMENAKETDIIQIPLSDIRTNPYQPRKHFDKEALDELATSIRNYGVFQPIIVKKSIKGYDLGAGERRLRASKLAGMETIPAIVKDFSDDFIIIFLNISTGIIVNDITIIINHPLIPKGVHENISPPTNVKII